MLCGMLATIDGAGRMVVPKAIREQAGLRPGDPLEVTYRDGRIEIEPAPRQVRLRERDGFKIAEPAGPYEPLSDETVRKTREQSRVKRTRR